VIGSSAQSAGASRLPHRNGEQQGAVELRVLAALDAAARAFDAVAQSQSFSSRQPV
jgi:hypothetical protein